MHPHDTARSVHFVGSFPLGSAREVFERVGETVGDLVRRVPDRETGERKDWIVFQRDRLVKLDSLESVGSWRVGKDLVYPLLTPRRGLAASDVALRRRFRITSWRSSGMSRQRSWPCWKIPSMRRTGRCRSWPPESPGPSISCLPMSMRACIFVTVMSMAPMSSSPMTWGGRYGGRGSADEGRGSGGS
jgi:hypothetical protein